jgi:hypothetical protein
MTRVRTGRRRRAHGLQEFLGADDAEGLEQLVADDALPAFATVEREVGGAP